MKAQKMKTLPVAQLFGHWLGLNLAISVSVCECMCMSHMCVCLFS